MRVGNRSEIGASSGPYWVAISVRDRADSGHRSVIGPSIGAVFGSHLCTGHFELLGVFGEVGISATCLSDTSFCVPWLAL